ncbi:hypothetical protein SAMN05216223_12954 [Actinacidiphila yanglinensis]|uniref:Uncharacterized protein n=1 Tax=Actinacidiphila yanglinensis TaxID=310779 RepID=A0A1H6EB33_9ACTN|nr:hypothetical protein SAMN05216223_12954 [Actinacidiphila yanglinensis]
MWRLTALYDLRVCLSGLLSHAQALSLNVAGHQLGHLPPHD